jgi:NAD(P)-dependent dehydrogenase (short-subunit alcohol dehydrogenase family)
MDLNLGGKLALITGGSRGNGRAVGEAIAAACCNVVQV